MKVLIVGGGGREHALSWKIAQSNRVQKLFVTPGNAGTALEAENIDLTDSHSPASHIPNIVRFAKQNQIDLTVVGPEAPLAAGLVDALEEENLRVFGPSKLAAELEASKVFCRNLLRQADIPSPEFHTFRDATGALTFLTQREDAPIVVKADGLAAGKGVIVCDNSNQAVEAVERIASAKEFGQADSQFVLEERLVGQEISVLAITDGQTIVTMPAAQDHKPAYDGGKGPNTGGMGAYSPAPQATESLMHTIEEKVLVPTVHQLKRSRRPFRGVLYAGLMLTQQGVKVLEYNVRFGDPECQVLAMRLRSDLLPALLACVDGQLKNVDLRWHADAALTVVLFALAAPGRNLPAINDITTDIENPPAFEAAGQEAANRGRDRQLVKMHPTSLVLRHTFGQPRGARRGIEQEEFIDTERPAAGWRRAGGCQDRRAGVEETVWDEGA